ncbi:MAG: type VI secretion system amidase effector protein Tae4 [Burkholderia sp.]
MPHNPPRRIAHNTRAGSIKEVPLTAITFRELWAAFPYGKPYKNPAYTNQCAIRMSVTLHRVGVSMKSFNSRTVKPMAGAKTIGRILLDGKPTATRAEELGEWLTLRPFVGLPKAENITGPDWESKVKGRTGIIQFSGYWQRKSERKSGGAPTGGHIDLWNGSRTTVASILEIPATFGRRLGIRSFFQNKPLFDELSWSDFGESRKILFWEIQ